MALLLVTNNAASTLSAGISSGATSLSLTSGGGSLFPSISGSEFFVATLVKNGVPTTFEIIKVTGRSGDSFTSIVRAQEGTTALSWNAGDTCALLLTAGDLGNYAQLDDLTNQAGNYASDTGTANAYVVALSPNYGTRVAGRPVRWQAAHTNTGSSTFNDGGGAASMQTEGNAALPAGAIVASNVYECIWNPTGSFWVLMGSVPVSFGQVSGTVSNAQVPQSAVTQYAAALFASPALTGTPTGPTASFGTDNGELATTAFVQEAVAPASSLVATGGYRTNGDGSLTQWGRLSYGGSGNPTITFPKAWPVGMFVCNITASIGGYQPGLASFNTSTMTWDMTNLGGTAQVFYWSAQGE